MNKCLLCLNLTFSKNALDLSEIQECGSTINEIIKFHFWFHNKLIDSTPDSSNIICKTCWIKLENFHEFFCAVKSNYNVSDEIVTESLDEAMLTTESALVKCEPFQSENEIQNESLEIETIEELSSIEVSSRRSLRRRKELLIDYNPKKEKKAKIILVELPKKKLAEFTNDEEEIMREHAEMKCEICSHEFTDWSQAMSHYQQSHPNTRGFIRCCGRKIDKRYEMIDHVKWHEDPTIFSCHICGKSLLTRENLMTHEGTHIPEELRQFQCPICPKKFGSSFSLQNHKRLHKKDKLEPSIPCPKCPERMYKTKAQLKLHWASCHKNVGQFMCELCSKVYKSKYTLEIHLKDHTNPDKPIECQICGHFIKNKRRFAVHMSRHKQTEEKPEGYPCPHCKKISKHKHALQSHIAYVHTESRFACEHCEKVFKHEGNLIEHQAQHTGIDLYRCPFCARTFKSNGNMHSHKKKMHPEEYAKLPPPSYLIPPSEKDENDE